MNIKSLIKHVIDKAVDRLVGEAEGDTFVATVAGKINLAVLSEHVDVDYDDLANAISYNELAEEVSMYELASEIDTGDLVEHLDVDVEDVARNMSVRDVAAEVDHERLADHFATEDIAQHFGEDDIAEAMGDISPRVAEHIDYAKLAKNLNPMEALAASQDGAEAEQERSRLNLDALAGKMVDAAVDKLLNLANKQVEVELAHEQATAEGNGVGAGAEESLLAQLGQRPGEAP